MNNHTNLSPAVIEMLSSDGLYLVGIENQPQAPVLVRGGIAYAINVKTLEVDAKLDQAGWNSGIKKSDIKKLYIGDGT